MTFNAGHAHRVAEDCVTLVVVSLANASLTFRTQVDATIGPSAMYENDLPA
jgi:hypothetical protein